MGSETSLGAGRQRAVIRFYAELNDFLPPARRFQPVEYRFHVAPALKDVIEGLGAPHTEVDLVVRNGESVGFEERLAAGDRVAVYPVFESIDIGPILKVRPEPLRVTRFVLDTHLGKLAAYLRMLGFDSSYSRQAADEALVRLSREERRILLTRDRGLLKRGDLTHGYCVRSADPKQQVREVVRRFDLSRAAKPFSRCMECNGELRPVSEEEIAWKLPERTRRMYREYRGCSRCGGVYWEGSHYRRMRRFIAEVCRPSR